MRIVVLVLLSVLLTVSPVMAKEKKGSKQMDPQAMMEVWQKLSMPGEPHKLFATLAGTWTTHTKEWMEPTTPPVESTGTASMKMLLDGRFLYHNFNGLMMGQPFSGIGIEAYDNITKKYVSTWIDSLTTGILIMEGAATPDGKTIVLRGSQVEPGGGKVMHRAIWKILDANNQTFELYGTRGRGKEMKLLEIVYTRKS